MCAVINLEAGHDSWNVQRVNNMDIMGFKRLQ